MKKTKLFKSLLVAAGLCVGASAWAGTVSTIYEKSLADWTSDDVTKTEGTLNVWYNSTGIVANNYLTGMMIDGTGLRVCARQTTATTELSLDRTANTIVTIDAVWNTGNESYPGNSNCNSFIYGDFKFDFYTRYKTTQFTINGVTKTITSAAADEEISIHLVVDSYTSEISELSIAKVSDPTVVYAKYSDLDATNNKFAGGCDYDKVIIKSVNGVSKNYNYTSLKSIKVQQETQDNIQTADYTVNWVCNNTTVKTETRNAAVGSTIGLVSSDTDGFFNSDESERYLYVSNDLNETTVAENGTTVVTITVRKAEKWSWTATAKYEETALEYTQTGEVWEDLNSISIAYPRFLAVGNQLVEKAPNGNDLRQSAKVTGNNFSVDLVYTAKEGVNNLYLLSEAEDLNTGIATSGTTFTSRVSNGLIIHASEGTLLSLPTGKYIFTLGVIGGDNTNHKVSYVVKAGETTIAEGTCTGNTLYQFTGEEFTLTANSTPITFTCSDQASGRGIDLIYIQKTSTEAQDKALRVYNIIGLGNDWDNEYQMTQSDVEGEEDIYTYTTTMVVKGNEEDNYFEYKVRQDSNWDGYKLPDGNNNASWKDKVNGIGIYTLTFTADVANHTLAVEATKEDFEYAVVGCTYEGSEEVQSVLFAGTKAWDTNTTDVMTKQNDGTYVWEKNNIVLPAKWIDLKVIARDGENVIKWFGNGEANVGLNINETGEAIYNITVTFNGTTVTATAEKQPTATIYFVNTGDWDAENIKVYVWNESGDNGWPGETMTATGEKIDDKDVYTWSSYALDLPTQLIISNNGSKTERTGDKAFIDGATYKADGSSTVSKTISAAGYATFCSASALDFTDSGLTAYIAKKGTDNKITFSTVTKVPASTGVLLKGAAGEYAINTTTAATDDVTGNVFEGVLVDTQVDPGIFVLMNGSAGVGFYVTTKTFTVGANTAYIPASVAGARTFIGFDFEDNTTTAIEGVANLKADNGEIYNLQGQRVVKAQKGLYIINGKKIVLK